MVSVPPALASSARHLERQVANSVTWAKAELMGHTRGHDEQVARGERLLSAAVDGAAAVLAGRDQATARELTAGEEDRMTGLHEGEVGPVVMYLRRARG